MSSSSTLIDVPWPRRLNSEVDPSLLSPDETPVLKNVMTRTLPHAVRPRNGLTYVAEWGSAHDTTNNTNFRDAATTWRPYAWRMCPAGLKLWVYLVNQQSDKKPDWPYFYDQKTLDDLHNTYDTASGTPYGWHWMIPGVNGYTNAPFNMGWVIIDPVSGGYLDGSEGNWDDEFGGGEWYWPNTVYYDNLAIGSSASAPTNNAGATKYYNSGATNYRYTTDYTDFYTALFGDEDFVSVSKNVTISNGSASGTMATPPAYSLAGTIMAVRGTPGTAGCPNPAYQFQYRVKEHTASSANFVLDRPYGIGENTTNVPNLVACNCSFSSDTGLGNRIPGGVCYTVFAERVFQGRGWVSATLTSGAPQAYPSPVGEYGGFYGNAIFWSKPGNWNRWPDQNFALVGENEPITALGTVGEKLVIFKEHQMFVMSGYDEDSFQIDKLSDVIGCPHPAGMTYYEGVLYFADQNGIWSFNGETVSSVSEPQPGAGISKLWNSRSYSRASGLDVKYFWPSMAVTPDGHLVVACQNPLSTTYTANFVYDIKNQAWSEWDLSTSSLNPVSVFSFKGKVYAIHRYFLSDITDCWNPAVTTPVYDTYPTLAASPVSTKLAVVPEVEVWVNATPGKTFRVREMQVDHKVHYSYTDSTPSYTPWTIKMATDPDLTLGSTEHSIAARWVNSSGYVATDPRHYSDRLPETYQREAQTLRVKFTGDTYPDSNLRMKDWTLLRLRFLIDQVRNMGVDNSTV